MSSLCFRIPSSLKSFVGIVLALIIMPTIAILLSGSCCNCPPSGCTNCKIQIYFASGGVPYKAKFRVEHGTETDVSNFIAGTETKLPTPPIAYNSDTAKDAFGFACSGNVLPAGEGAININVPCGDSFVLSQFTLEIVDFTGGCPCPPGLIDFELSSPIIAKVPFQNGSCIYNINLSLSNFTCLGCTP